jgi:hypothetical protein
MRLLLNVTFCSGATQTPDFIVKYNRESLCQGESMSEHIFEDYQQRVSEAVYSLEAQNREELETVAQILSRITHLPSEQIKPQLHTLMENLIELKDAPFHVTATPQEWSQHFSEWVASHRGLNFPTLSDEAISRESIYGDDR